MAITRSQQAKQMLQDGGMLVSPSKDGKRPGYRSEQFQSARQKSMSAPKSTAKNTSFTGGGGGSNNGGGNNKVDVGFQEALRKQKIKKAIDKETKPNFIDVINPFTKEGGKFRYNISMGIPGQKERSAKYQKAYRDYLISMGVTPPDTLTGEEDDLADFFVENAFDKPVAADANVQPPQSYGDFLLERFGTPGVKFSGNVGGKEVYVKGTRPDGSKIYDVREKLGGDGDGGMSDYERRLLELQQALKTQTAAATPTPTIFQPNFRLLADGGMAERAPYEGGIMDLESARQMYGFGKLVKKIGRSVKKIVKSPIGKAAIAAAAFKFGPAFFGKNSFNPFLKIAADGSQGFSPFGAIARKLGIASLEGGLTGFGKIAALGVPSVIAGLTTKQNEDDEEQLYAGADLPNPVDFYLSGQYAPNMRLAAEGGKPEPVAKKTMPLLDMGGMEKDYREEGGFVPIGRMEKADDVPARLSKNEFVFTADAVRNAGDGDVDLGAEKMYNMMKNLEAGGDVSEESQGMDGARKMFQTSQRLEEVL